MWLAFYNPEAVGDVLMLTSGKADEDLLNIQSQGRVTLIEDKNNGQVVGVNIFNASQDLEISQVGPIELSESQVNTINQIIKSEGFNLEIEVDNSPKFVVGYVEECRPHEDSDHLSITKTNVGDESLDIVCGASNIAQGLSVIVAKPGAVMPNGSIIWPGELRGVMSHGMICSSRELNLTELEDLPGIWELPKGYRPGQSLYEVVESYRNH